MVDGPIFAGDRGSLHFNTVVGGDLPANIRINFTSPETRMIVVPDAEDRTIVSSFLWTKHRNVTEGQTDRQICRAMQTRCKNL